MMSAETENRGQERVKQTRMCLPLRPYMTWYADEIVRVRRSNTRRPRTCL
jgi:hypothetical protein